MYLDPDNSPDEYVWVTRSQGNNWLNRLSINPNGHNPSAGIADDGSLIPNDPGRLPAGGSSNIKIEFVAPSEEVDARRMYVRFMVG